MKNAERQKGLSKEEVATMKEYLKEKNSRVNGEEAVLAAIAKMKGTDQAISKRLHVLVKQSAPSLMPRTWYGMPAYSDKDGNVVCFFQPAAKFKARYLTLGFSDKAKLDDGMMWPVVYAIKKLTKSEEAQIATLVKQAIG